MRHRAEASGCPAIPPTNVSLLCLFFFFSSRRRHTRLQGDWSSDVCSSDLPSVYGTDNACTLDGVKRTGARARAIVVIDKSTPRGALQEMAAGGARGIRLNQIGRASCRERV